MANVKVLADLIFHSVQDPMRLARYLMDNIGGEGVQGPKGEKGDPGEPFTVKKTYASVSAMNAGFASDGVKQGQFVLINTGNVNDADNAKLYVKGSEQYDFITDLSGSAGIKGDKGDKGEQGIQGAKGATGATGAPGVAGANGKDAPKITGLTINVTGTTISGQATMSEGAPINVTGTFSQG